MEKGKGKGVRGEEETGNVSVRNDTAVGQSRRKKKRDTERRDRSRLG